MGTAAHSPPPLTSLQGTPGKSDYFFGSPAWTAIQVSFLIVVGFVWLGSVGWTWNDAGRRSDSVLFRLLATANAVAIPGLGVLIYLLVRPQQLLAEVREEALLLQALEREVEPLERCPICRAPTTPEFLVCPVCATRLRRTCSGCGRPLQPLWQMCPACQTPVEAPAQRVEGTN